MSAIEIILLPVAIGLLFAEFSGIPQWFTRWLWKTFKIGRMVLSGHKIPIRIKPFDCGMCLSFWIAIAQNYFLSYSIYHIIGYAAISGCLAHLILKTTNKLT
jgi:hypothetical protein